MVFFAEAYYAALVRETVYDAAGVRLGRVADLLIKPRERYPVLSRIVVRPGAGGQDLLIPWQLVRSASYEGFRLSVSQQHLPQAARRSMRLFPAYPDLTLSYRAFQVCV